MPRPKKETIYTRITPYIIPVLTGILVLLSLVLVFFRVYQDRILSGDQVLTDTFIQPTPDPELVARTIYWEDYEDQENAFSLRYPADKLKNTNNEPLFVKAGICTKKEVQVLTLEPTQFNTESLPTEVYADLLQFTVHIEEIDENQTVQSWLDTNCRDRFDPQNNYIKSETTVYGLPALQFDNIRAQDEAAYITGKTHRVLIHGSRLYIFTTQYSFDPATDDESIQQGKQMLEDMVKTVRILE